MTKSTDVTAYDAKSAFSMLNDSLKCKDNYITLTDGYGLYDNGTVKKLHNNEEKNYYDIFVTDPNIESAKRLFSSLKFKENAEEANKNIGRRKNKKATKKSNKSEKRKKRPFFHDVIFEIVEENSTLRFKEKKKVQRKRTTPRNTTPKKSGRLYVRIIYSGTMSHK